jgi:hypothetical protein
MTVIPATVNRLNNAVKRRKLDASESLETSVEKMVRGGSLQVIMQQMIQSAVQSALAPVAEKLEVMNDSLKADLEVTKSCLEVTKNRVDEQKNMSDWQEEQLNALKVDSKEVLARVDRLQQESATRDSDWSSDLRSIIAAESERNAASLTASVATSVTSSLLLALSDPLVYAKLMSGSISSNTITTPLTVNTNLRIDPDPFASSDSSNPISSLTDSNASRSPPCMEGESYTHNVRPPPQPGNCRLNE